MILTLKVLLVLFVMTAIQINTDAQNYSQLKQSYLNLNEIAFKVRIISNDKFKGQPYFDEKFYKVSIPDSSKARQWINYNIIHVDTQSHHLSIYQSEKSQIICASHSDTFKTLYQLNKWDSTYSCLQNPPSYSSFTLSFPLVECFYPEDSDKKNLKFKDANGYWFFKDYHPKTRYRRHVWVNKSTGLVDSIHEYNHKFLVHRISFEYYYTQTSTEKKTFSPLPDFYPLELTNPKVMQIVNVPLPIKTMNRFDSSNIQKFLDKNKKLMLIDFWFIGCRPCHQAFPILQKIKKDYPESILQIVAFSPFDEKSEIHHFKTKSKINFDMVYDSLHLNLFYQVHAYPCTILINENGEILYRHDGANGNMEADLRKILDGLIKL